MKTPLKVLIIEDSENDTLLLLHELKKGGYDVIHERVETAAEMKRALSEGPWDIILSDNKMPCFDAFRAFAVAQETAPFVPFIIVSGCMGEDLAVEAMRIGVQDYLLKGNLTRLVPAIKRELKEARIRMEHRRAEEKIRQQAEILSQIHDAIVTTDLEGTVTSWNKGAERLLGYGESEAVGRPVSFLYPEDWRDRLRNEVIAPLKEKGRHGTEVVAKTKTGDLIHMRLSLSLLRDAEGSPTGMVGYSLDITGRVRAEMNLQKSYEKLKAVLNGVVTAISLTVEARDPYTAGHQRRVALLASKTAKKMGLSDSGAEEIYLTGTIHDLGKVAVPSEILTKSGQLTEFELSIMKTHPKVAYDILKNIEFPWPLAEIVAQHHERMDGSGYPEGLKDEAIRVEARILGVADVIEAMASHRPYRPALGIEQGIAEISKNKGILYDPEVVDACLQVLAEPEFDFAAA